MLQLSICAVVAAVLLLLGISAYRSFLTIGGLLVMVGLGLILFRDLISTRAHGLDSMGYTHDGKVTFVVISGLIIGLVGFVVMRYLAPFAHARSTMPR